ncbi:serine hydrolase [Nonomuraea sp. NEAU-L178]|nr:serine hydrolase [Nonomuraea aurantiaca]
MDPPGRNREHAVTRPPRGRTRTHPAHGPSSCSHEDRSPTTNTSCTLMHAQQLTVRNPSLDWAAGEMISTMADLEGFMAALLGGKLTSAESLRAMRTTVDTKVGFAYGLGLQAYTLPCGTVWGHSGELIGYLTFAFRSDSGKSLTMSLNPSTRNPSTQEVMGIAVNVFCGAAG